MRASEAFSSASACGERPSEEREELGEERKGEASGVERKRLRHIHSDVRIEDAFSSCLWAFFHSLASSG